MSDVVDLRCGDCFAPLHPGRACDGSRLTLVEQVEELLETVKRGERAERIISVVRADERAKCVEELRAEADRCDVQAQDMLLRDAPPGRDYFCAIAAVAKLREAAALLERGKP